MLENPPLFHNLGRGQLVCDHGIHRVIHNCGLRLHLAVKNKLSTAYRLPCGLKSHEFHTRSPAIISKMLYIDGDRM